MLSISVCLWELMRLLSFLVYLCAVRQYPFVHGSLADIPAWFYASPIYFSVFLCSQIVWKPAEHDEFLLWSYWKNSSEPNTRFSIKHNMFDITRMNVRLQNQRTFLQQWTGLSQFNLSVAKKILLELPYLTVIRLQKVNFKTGPNGECVKQHELSLLGRRSHKCWRWWEVLMMHPQVNSHNIVKREV